MRGQRTKAAEIFARSLVLVFIISMLIAGVWNWATETNFWTPTEIALSSFLIVLVFGGGGWLIVNFGMKLLFGRNSAYKQFIQSGGDPYLDSLPSPMNPDSQLVRETGLQEPETDFTPPRHWKFQCPVCGARQPSQVCVCWNCNYGADGDSSAYYRRWGGTPPTVPTVPSAQTDDDNNGPHGYDVPVDQHPH